jgi:squalene-associated FAD-dependent desaturase
MESLGIRLIPNVAIVGGGCAGLAAAAQLAEAGIKVTVFEAANHVGGRARGLNWKGRRLDNGQHILLGAYTETLRLLHMAGVDLTTAFQRLPLQLIQHAQFNLRASSRLPAPLHILSGLLRAKGITLPERVAALRFMARLKLTGFKLAHDQPLGTFLTQHHQPEKLIKWLWEPLCLAALNTPVDQASTQVFLNVLRDSFSRSRHDSDLLLPRQDLSTLIAEPLAAFIRSRGGEIRLGTSVTSMTTMNQGFTVKADEASLPYSHVVVAVSPFRASETIADMPELQAAAQACTAFEYQPIYTVYLQYPAEVRLPFPMIGMTGGHTQWVLDRGALDGQAGLLSVVISAEGPHQNMTQEALAIAVGKELKAAFTHLPDPLWHKVIAEKRATFTCRPNLQRPSQLTVMQHLYLAGDYTAGDYPATIEGAVRSGVKCANFIIRDLQETFA